MQAIRDSFALSDLPSSKGGLSDTPATTNSIQKLRPIQPMADGQANRRSVLETGFTGVHYSDFRVVLSPASPSIGKRAGLAGTGNPLRAGG
jgi:hypothetical protein